MFWLFVCLPLAVIVVIGWRLARDEHAMAQQRMRNLLSARLQDSDRILRTYFDEQQVALARLLDAMPLDAAAIRETVRDHPLVAQIFVIHPSGALLHPDTRGPLNDSERRFLEDFGALFVDNSLIHAGTREGRQATVATGWLERFHGPGLHLIYYQRNNDGVVRGVLLPRARWMADLIERLPTTEVSAARGMSPSACTCLVDSTGRPVYRWGMYEPAENETPLQEWVAHPPLASWRLQHFGDTTALTAVGRTTYLSMLSALAATVVVMVIGGAWFCREYNRRTREATHRVSFVNQVSHELKTPLTNIRMYAELLERDLAAAGPHDTAHRKHLGIIVDESQRLSRLIGNVLTFAQSQRQQLSVRPRPAVVDDIITAVVTHFSPTLNRCGIDVTVDAGAGHLVEVDVDAVEQILGNLINNVEKYASAGERLEICSCQDGATTTIVVCDHGPGIPGHHRDRIFDPFHRVSDRISDAPGTGIGLPIARELARLHGGDVCLTASETGARFEVTLHTPLTSIEATT